LSLEKMAVKEFGEVDQKIDAPGTNDFGAVNDDMETEDEITVDPR
jgi:hypothetical protein